MKAMAFFSVILLLCTLALCIASTILVHSLLDEMALLHEETLSCTDNDDPKGALVALTNMARLWSDSGVWLEMLADHEDIHNVREQIVSAKALLENDDMAQYRQSMALVREGLDHIRRAEALSLSNIF